MKAIQIDGKDIHLPTNWFEVTVSQYKKLLRAEGLINQLEALSGVAGIQWENLSNIDFENHISGTISFLNDPIDFTGLPVPKSVKIADMNYIVPQDITIETWGQKISLQNELAKLEGNNTPEAYTDAVVFAVAVYLVPKPYSDDKAREFVSQIDDCLITDIFPAGDFFFRSWINSALENRSSLLSNLPPNRSGQE